MLRTQRVVRWIPMTALVVALTGCASSEVANVSFSYNVTAAKGLPPGMKTIAILPAKVTDTTDPKWSDMATTILAGLVNDSRNTFGTDLIVTERRDTNAVFDEADLSAAGMSTKQGGTGGKLISADGYVLGKINVKIEKHKGKKRTISGLSLSGFGGNGWRGGSGSVRTSEVETVTRNMTVQTEFKLIDTGNGRVWEHYAPRTYSRTDATKASAFFGSSQTEAELTPQDKIIYALVERGARDFIAQLMPCRVDVDAVVTSSNNAECIQGVKMLRAEAWDAAISHFKAAVAENSDDHCAAFGAGVAYEASGQFNDAIKYYKKACAGQDNPDYRDARDRMKQYRGRLAD